jgi:hypothetical protein
VRPMDCVRRMTAVRNKIEDLIQRASSSKE